MIVRLLYPMTELDEYVVHDALGQKDIADACELY